MEPLKPLAGMKPMQPLDFGAPWWPSDLGEPSTTGAQNGARYAYFPAHRRLLVEADGEMATYDTGEHHIEGVSQAQSRGRPLSFTSQDGVVNLDDLKRI